MSQPRCIEFHHDKIIRKKIPNASETFSDTFNIERAAKLKEGISKRKKFASKIRPSDKKRDKALILIITALIIASEVLKDNLHSTTKAIDFITVAVMSFGVIVGIPRAYAVIFHQSKPIGERTLERARKLVELIKIQTPYECRRSLHLFNLSSKNAKVLIKMRYVTDQLINRSEKDTGLFMSLGLEISLLSLVVATAVVFSYESDVKSAMLDKVFIYCSIQRIYGLLNTFPVLATSIKHTHLYNNEFASVINDRIVDITEVMTLSSTSQETREEMKTSTLLLKAMHNSIVKHPVFLRVFAVPVTQTVYACLLILILPLAASIAFRLVTSEPSRAYIFFVFPSPYPLS